MRPNRTLLVLLALIALVSTAAAEDLASVRYQRSGTSHFYLSTHNPARVGELEITVSLYLLADRYVAVYSESKRRSPSESVVLLSTEIAGTVSGGTLANLGALRLVGGTKNGKPVAELVLDRQISSSPRGLALQLAWTGGSWAPKSVQ
ncbi:MAG: hypothetical protein ABI867_34360 [Kofleriaceae bacterium]